MANHYVAEVEPHLPLQAVQVPSDGTSLPMEEFTTVQLGGPVDVIPHPRNQVMGLVMVSCKIHDDS